MHGLLSKVVSECIFVLVISGKDIVVLSKIKLVVVVVSKTASITELVRSEFVFVDAKIIKLLVVSRGDYALSVSAELTKVIHLTKILLLMLLLLHLWNHWLTKVHCTELVG